MIAIDQPTCFPADLIVAVSSRDDGTMLDRARGAHHPDIIAHRQALCRARNITYSQTVYQRIIYDESRSYVAIAEVDSGATTQHTAEVVADGLVTRYAGVALLLPVADCVATVVYDPVRRVLMLLHLGRHSTVAGLMDRALRWLAADGSRPEDIVVWMSPSAQASHYVMQWFDRVNDPDWREFCEQAPDGIHLDLQGYNAAVCRRAGLLDEHIHRSSVNTVTDPNYFSHTAGDVSGRFAVVAMML